MTAIAPSLQLTKYEVAAPLIFRDLYMLAGRPGEREFYDSLLPAQKKVGEFVQRLSVAPFKRRDK